MPRQVIVNRCSKADVAGQAELADKERGDQQRQFPQVPQLYVRWGFPRPDGSVTPRPPASTVPEPEGRC
jgi:hypothetical protein